MEPNRVAQIGRNGRRFAARSTHQGFGIPANIRIKSKAEIHSFADCVAFLGGERELPVASNVRIVVREGTPAAPKSIAVRLYNTDIITYHDDETFGFTNGGFYTPTTSARANQFGPRGYFFGNSKFLLHAGGTPEREGQRLPVFPVRHWAEDQGDA